VIRTALQATARAFDMVGLTRFHRNRSPYLLSLAYHRIGVPALGFDPEIWSATPEDFDAQVRYLASSFDVITPDDLPDIQAGRRGRFAMITFDDGYRDNYETALPILRAHRARAVFFVTTGFMDGTEDAWWDRIAAIVERSVGRSLAAPPYLETPLHVQAGARAAVRHRLLAIYKGLPGEDARRLLALLEEQAPRPAMAPGSARTWMSWDEVRGLRDAGMHVGGHTHSHPVLARLNAAEQERELRTCATRLSSELRSPMTAFSYPVGGADAFDEVTRSHLAALGVRYAFSYYGGVANWCAFDPYDVRRIGIELDHDRQIFRAIVSSPRIFSQL
jgi:peptidoglycan/xylan/chitin deacetylase (PgdA/CDA1 family)